MNEAKTYSVDFAGKQISFEFGKLAGQADAACVVKMGETMVLATVVTSTQQREGINFLPLTVDYEERMYAAGKISGSRFIKREGRPSEDAILNARIIDRSIRPLFPKGYFYDVQVVIMVLSTDLENDPGILAMIAASTVLHVSQIPWNGPVAGVKVGMVNDKIIACPTATELSGSSLDLTLAASRDAVVMVEAGAREIEEEKMEQAIKAGFESAQPVLELIEKIRKEIGKEKIKVDLAAETELEQKIKKAVAENLEPAIMNSKSERNEFIEEIYGKLVEELGNEDEPAVAAEIKEVLDSLVKKEVRKIILGKKIRPDSRGFGDIRPISCEVGFLPRVHGTGLFNRGQTQALTTVTLGSLSAAMLIDTMEEETTKKYMHFYNFPPFSTGEARPMRTASRREIGHGALAERALLPVIPSQESFPYTLRLVSEILSSNGSSSMASVCGSTLALMDAGVPISSPVAGIAMGLMTDGDKYEILSDIQGIEDFSGDMDFKVAGTKKGITALQLDVKIAGLSFDIINKTFAQARIGREFILEEMLAVIAAPRKELSKHAPRLVSFKINPDKIRDVIGPGGKVINKMIADFGVEIDIEQDGTVFVYSAKQEAVDRAVEEIKGLTADVEVGKIYRGKVTRLMDFGAFVEILPKQEGLVHISQLSDQRVNKVSDVVNVGDTVNVRVVEIDDLGRVNLSMKAAKQEGK